MPTKKNTKKTTVAKRTVKPRMPKMEPVTVVTAEPKSSCFNAWSLSIYIYWFIILFFIAATFYILGRSHSILHPATTPMTPEQQAEVLADQLGAIESAMAQNGVVPSITVDNVTVSEEDLKQASDYLASGRSNLVSGNLADAVADFTAAIDAGNTDMDTYIMRGEAYMQAGNFAAAMNDLDYVIDTDPMNAIAYYDRTLMHIRMENYDDALADINNALAAQASRPTHILNMRDLYARRGQLNLWLKNWQGAIADYTNSVARAEGTVNPAVYAERAEAYTAIGEYASAINDYATAIRIIEEQIQLASTDAARETMPANAMTYFEKSAALNLGIGNADAARSDLESAYTIAAALNDTESMTRLSNLILELNN